MKRLKLIAVLLAATSAAAGSAQPVDVFFDNTDHNRPYGAYGRVAFDPSAPGRPDIRNTGTFAPVDSGGLTFTSTPRPGDMTPVASFGPDDLSYSWSRIEDSLQYRVRVNPEVLAPGDSLELLFGNSEGNRLTFPAYTSGPGGFTTALFRYNLGGRSGSFQTSLEDRTAWQVPEPAPIALFVLALATLAGARRKHKRLAEARLLPATA